MTGNANPANEWRFTLRPLRGWGMFVTLPKNKIKNFSSWFHMKVIIKAKINKTKNFND